MSTRRERAKQPNDIMVAIGFIIVVTIGATIVYLHDRKTLLKD